MTNERKNVLICGSGIFGLSTAYSLLKSNKYNVIIVEKSQQIPAYDSASTDISKIVRPDYSNKIYSELASDSIKDLKSHWSEYFHQCGMLVFGESEYALSSYENVKAQHPNDVKLIKTEEELKSMLPSNIPVNYDEKRTAYFNGVAGWIESGKATRALYEECTKLGLKSINGFEVKNIIWENDKVVGVESSEDMKLTGFDKVIIAAGAWAPSLDKKLDKLLVSSAQSVTMIKLKDEQYNRYKNNSPVVINLNTGHYLFPPTETKYLKVSRHHAGYLTKTNTPVKLDVKYENLDNGPLLSTSKIPIDMYEDLREGLRGIYPEIADDEKLESAYRLCWYSDADLGDFVIDYHPDSNGTLLYATGGSGHAFKFFTVLGKLVHDRLENKLDDQLTHMFRQDRKCTGIPVVDKSRLDNVRRDFHTAFLAEGQTQ